ncbi:hypothetical protein [Massilia sp. Root335]|uniref:hypothetical protein n=1 Tax=Massilia sp. Root335 TaxID=1736517 RepID=UPI0012F65962|nr:hypothetical protein [Massilia sp. Root335]
MNEDDELEYLKVPLGFPHPVSTGMLPGTQPKFLVVSYQGKFYLPGCTPPELYERWRICEEIAQQLTIKSRDSKEGKRSHMSESAILEQYLPWLTQTNLTTEAEARWVILRVAEILEWPIPPLATANS